MTYYIQKIKGGSFGKIFEGFYDLVLFGSDQENQRLRKRAMTGCHTAMTTVPPLPPQIITEWLLTLRNNKAGSSEIQNHI